MEATATTSSASVGSGSRTIADLIPNAAAKHGEHVAIRYKRDGEWYEVTYAQLAQTLDVPLVGQVPLVTALREGGDEGRPITVTDPDGEAAAAFTAIADKVVTELAPKRIYKRELTIR